MTFINKQNIPQVQDLKKVNKYDFQSNNKYVTVFDDNIDFVVSIYNETINKTLYVLGDQSYGGVRLGNKICYTTTVTGVSDGDKLYILYKPKVNDIRETLSELKEVVKELRINNIHQSIITGEESL